MYLVIDSNKENEISQSVIQGTDKVYILGTW